MRNTPFQNQLCGSRGEGWQRLHSLEKVVFFLFFCISIVFFSTFLFVFVGFSLEVSTFVQKPTFRDEEEGAAEAPKF